jgi:hypothetical protein
VVEFTRVSLRSSHFFAFIFLVQRVLFTNWLLNADITCVGCANLDRKIGGNILVLQVNIRLEALFDIENDLSNLLYVLLYLVAIWKSFETINI